MKRRLLNLFILSIALGACTQKEKAQKVIIKNPLPEPVKELVFNLDSKAVVQSIAAVPGDQLVLMDGDRKLPFQLIKKNGETKSILTQADFSPNEEKEIRIKAGQPSPSAPKTQAEISVKEGGKWVWVTKNNGNQQYEYQGGHWKNVDSLWVDKKHTDHSFDIRYEGPGWESDKIGFRFYLDWRNAADIFGKKVDTLVLQNVGIDGFDSYHEMSAWGVDILEVGNSLGIGTIAHWADSMANRVAKTDSVYSEVTYSGILESKITTKYYGWEYAGGKTNLTSGLSIRAGSYLTKEHLISGEPVDNFCTGMVKMDSTTVLVSPEGHGEWAYLATFGVQSLQNDHMGLFIFYRKKDFMENTEDQFSHVVVLRPEGKELTYYYGGVWEQDASHIDTMEKMEAFLEKQLALLNSDMIR